MAKISKLDINGMVTDNGFHICFFCNKYILSGGCWAGHTDIAICPCCAEKLFDLYIDTLDDTNIQFKNSSKSEKIEFISNAAEVRLNKKDSIKF